MDLSRRRFLQSSTATLAAGVAAGRGLLPSAAHAAGSPEVPGQGGPVPLLEGPMKGEIRQGDMIYRPLGTTGEKVSLIGLGGAHANGAGNDEKVVALIRAAIDGGINFMDNCWDYGNGEAERKMGLALRDGYRQKVFLMTKIDGRTRQAAARQIDECLSRLQTDHVDLLQHHEILRMEDPDAVFAEGGAMEAVVAARKAGKVRFIGFTGHKDPSVHLRMLDAAKRHSFHFDTVQMPVNLMDAHFRSFSREVIPHLTKAGIALLAMKTMGGGILLKSKAVDPIDCLHYAMSLPSATVIAGMDSPKRLEQAFEAVRTYKPLTRERLAALLENTRVAAAEGKYEAYKTSTRFDGTTHNPQWLGYAPWVPRGTSSEAV